MGKAAKIALKTQLPQGVAHDAIVSNVEQFKSFVVTEIVKKISRLLQTKHTS